MFACVYQPGSGNEFRESLPELLVELARSFSPLVEETTPDTVVLNVDGCERLFGYDPLDCNSLDWLEKIATSGSERGLSANVAAASNPDAAVHAARGFTGLTFIAPGQEAEQLGCLPLEMLVPALAGVEEKRAFEIIETLRLWGINCFGDFAALPQIGVSERLGLEGVMLQKLACGISNRSLVVTKQAPIFEKIVELDHPIELIEQFCFVMERMLEEICSDLQSRGLATNELTLRLKLDNQTEQERALRLPVPMYDHRMLLRLAQLNIEMSPPQAAMRGIAITAMPVRPRSLQSGLFRPLGPEPQKLELTLARLAKLVGPDNVGCAEILNTHRPGAFGIHRFGNNRKKLKTNSAKTKMIGRHATSIEGTTAGLRVFRPPLPAKVKVAGDCPVRVTAPNTNRAQKINGKIIRAVGPWRTTGDWWDENGWARDEWDIALEDAYYRIYRELDSGSWFVDGAYD